MSRASISKMRAMRAVANATTTDLIWQLNQHAEKCRCILCGPARVELIKRGVSVTKPKIAETKES